MCSSDLGDFFGDFSAHRTLSPCPKSIQRFDIKLWRGSNCFNFGMERGRRVCALFGGRGFGGHLPKFVLVDCGLRMEIHVVEFGLFGPFDIELSTG